MLLLVFGPRYFAGASRGADENHGGTGCGAPNFCAPSVGALSIDDAPSRGTPCVADTASVPRWPAWCDGDPERLAVLKTLPGMALLPCPARQQPDVAEQGGCEHRSRIYLAVSERRHRNRHLRVISGGGVTRRCAITPRLARGGNVAATLAAIHQRLGGGNAEHGLRRSISHYFLALVPARSGFPKNSR